MLDNQVQEVVVLEVQLVVMPSAGQLAGGGAGLASSITGSSVTRAGGGGGCFNGYISKEQVELVEVEVEEGS
jgi:hypothetical protein